MNYTWADLVALEKRDIPGITDAQANIAAAIAEAESGGNPAAHGDVAIGGSYGLWQVYQPAHPGTQAAALDPDQAVQLMWQISNHGTNWNPWSTYKNGAYKQYLSGSASPQGSPNNTTTASAVSPLGFTASTITRTVVILFGLAVVAIGFIVFLKADRKRVEGIINAVPS